MSDRCEWAENVSVNDRCSSMSSRDDVPVMTGHPPKYVWNSWTLRAALIKITFRVLRRGRSSRRTISRKSL